MYFYAGNFGVRIGKIPISNLFNLNSEQFRQETIMYLQYQKENLKRDILYGHTIVNS